MYTAQRFVTALEMTFWLVLLLLVGIVQPANQDLGNSVPKPSFTAMAPQPSSLPPHLRRQPPLHRPIGGWLPVGPRLK